MEKIKNTVLTVMEGLAAKKSSLPDNGPEDLLKKLLTKKELQHIKFNYFKEGVVYINIDSSAWLYSLNLKKETLLKQMRLENSQIKNLRLRVGEVK